MSAWCEWKLHFNDDARYMEPILDYLNTIDPGCFGPGKKSISTDNCSAKHIWGSSSYMDPDVETYIDLAKLAPEAQWNVESEITYEGGGGNDHSFLEVYYQDHILTVRKLVYTNYYQYDPEYWDIYKYKIERQNEDLVEVLLLHSPETKHDEYIEEDEWDEEYEDAAVPVRDWEPAESVEGLCFAISGRCKIFENQWHLSHSFREINANGSATVCQKTRYLIDCDPELETVKKRKAREMGIPILTEEEFVRRFHNPKLLEKN